MRLFRKRNDVHNLARILDAAERFSAVILGRVQKSATRCQCIVQLVQKEKSHRKKRGRQCSTTPACNTVARMRVQNRSHAGPDCVPALARK